MSCAQRCPAPRRPAGSNSWDRPEELGPGLRWSGRCPGQKGETTLVRLGPRPCTSKPGPRRQGEPPRCQRKISSSSCLTLSVSAACGPQTSGVRGTLSWLPSHTLYLSHPTPRLCPDCLRHHFLLLYALLPLHGLLLLSTQRTPRRFRWTRSSSP